MVMRVLILELLLELLVVSAEHALHEQQVREHLGVVPRHLLEYTHVAVVHVVIPDVHHRGTEHRFFVVLSHNQVWVGTVGWDCGERAGDPLSDFVVIHITTDYNVHIVAVLMSLPELPYHVASYFIFYVLLLAQNRESE